MHSRSWLATALAIVSALSMALAADRLLSQAVDLGSLDGEWIFVEERWSPPLGGAMLAVSRSVNTSGSSSSARGH